MLAYLGKPELKTFVLGQLAEHREADRLIKGDYWKDGKGCGVGCTLEAVRLFNGGRDINHRNHALYEPNLGIPEVIAHLEDLFFEKLSDDASQAWPERFTSAIRVGADLTMVWPRFALWLLTEEIPPRTRDERALKSLAAVGALYREWANGAKPHVNRWINARNVAADASAYTAAVAAVGSDTASYAADATAYTAAVAAAQSCYVRMSDRLIALLEAA